MAEILSCTDRHIYDLIVEGALDAIKVGGRAMRVSEKSLEEFIEKQKVNPEDYFDPDKETKPATAPAEHPVARSKFLGR